MSNKPTQVPDVPLHTKEMSERVTLLAHIRKTPNLLYGIFVELARQLYSDKSNVPIDTKVVWCDNPAKTGIWIDTDYQWDDESPEKRPAIFVKLDPIEYKSQTGRHDALMRVDLEQGEYIYSRNGYGKVSFIHIGRSSGESTVLSGATLDFFDAFGRVIRDDFCFDIFKVVSWRPGGVSDDESTERFRNTVTVEFSFEDTWRLKLESPKLKRVIFNTGQSLITRGILDS